jgi:tetratricopeptide (TPR) repeat protein
MTAMPASLFAFLSLAASVWAAPQPAGEIDRLIESGRASYAKGDYPAAKETLQQAWQLAEETQAEPSKRYDLLKQLARTLAGAQEYLDAEKYLQQALNLKETALKAAPVETIPDLVELAMMCRGLKDYPRGLAILARVVEIHVRSGGTFNSEVVADAFSRMALLHLDAKEPDQAANTLEQAIGIRGRLLGTEHLGLLPELDRLAPVRIALREYEKAEEVYRRALVLRELALGASDPDLIATLDGLAYACFGQKKYDQAETFYKRLLDLWMTSAGAEHPMVALTLDKMVTFYRAQQRFEDAAAAEDRALGLRAHFLANGLAREAGAQIKIGNAKAAVDLYRRALVPLDPERPEHAKLRQEIEDQLAVLRPPPKRSPKKRAPSK